MLPPALVARPSPLHGRATEARGLSLHLCPPDAK